MVLVKTAQGSNELGVIFEVLYNWKISVQVDEEPAIRTNTTILLGNIASNLNDAVCSQLY
jgi:hypothetical protein